jgi:hypothetical protein
MSNNKSKSNKLRDPNTLKSGHVARLSTKKYVVVKRNKSGKARYVKARPNDIKCSKTLKRNVKEMINDVKSKKIKTYKQALAIAYNKTQKKFPKCELIKQTKKRKLGFKNQKAGGLFFHSTQDYIVKIIKKLLKKKILIKTIMNKKLIIINKYYKQSIDNNDKNKLITDFKTQQDIKQFISKLNYNININNNNNIYMFASQNEISNISNDYFKLVTSSSSNNYKIIDDKKYYNITVNLTNKGLTYYNKHKTSHKKLFKYLYKLIKKLNKNT